MKRSAKAIQIPQVNIGEVPMFSGRAIHWLTPLTSFGWSHGKVTRCRPFIGGSQIDFDVGNHERTTWCDVALSIRFLSFLILSCASDTLKGSYYANPITEEETVSPQGREAFPEYYGKNICETIQAQRSQQYWMTLLW